MMQVEYWEQLLADVSVTRAKKRHKMHEDAGAVCADELDTSIEEYEGQNAWKNCYIGDRKEGRHGGLQLARGEMFISPEGHVQKCGDYA